MDDQKEGGMILTDINSIKETDHLVDKKMLCIDCKINIKFDNLNYCFSCAPKCVQCKKLHSNQRSIFCSSKCEKIYDESRCKNCDFNKANADGYCEVCFAGIQKLKSN